MEWSKVDVAAPPRHTGDDQPVNWLQFDGLFLRAALVTSATVSLGWVFAILLSLGSFQQTVLGEAATEEFGPRTESEPLMAELVFLLIPLFGLWMAARALRDRDDVLAIVALIPLHLLAVPASAMIAIDAIGFVVTIGALLSLIGNLAYVVLVWLENRVWKVG